jgi:hypothetical protein
MSVAPDRVGRGQLRHQSHDASASLGLLENLDGQLWADLDAPSGTQLSAR